MKRNSSKLVFTITIALSIGLAISVWSGEPEELTQAKCITWEQEVRPVDYAFNHYVHIKNSCDKPFECRVSSAENPDGVTTTVNAKGKATALVYRGSPARVFKASVACKVQK